MNYFDLFGLKPAIRIDKASISATYFDIQRSVHPDFFMNATETEKEQALQRSSIANEAYATLTNPQKTLEYYLRTTGTILEGEKHQLSPDFLMEMMELNDELEEKDQAAARQEILRVEEAIKSPILIYLSGEVDPDDEGRQALKEYYYQKKYLERILERLGD